MLEGINKRIRNGASSLQTSVFLESSRIKAFKMNTTLSLAGWCIWIGWRLMSSCDRVSWVTAWRSQITFKCNMCNSGRLQHVIPGGWKSFLESCSVYLWSVDPLNSFVKRDNNRKLMCLTDIVSKCFTRKSKIFWWWTNISIFNMAFSRWMVLKTWQATGWPSKGSLARICSPWACPSSRTTSRAAFLSRTSKTWETPRVLIQHRPT